MRHLVHERGERFGVGLGRRGHVARAGDGARRRVDEDGRDREARRSDDLVEDEAQPGVGRRVGGPLDGLGEARALASRAGSEAARERVERVPLGPVARRRGAASARCAWNSIARAHSSTAASSCASSRSARRLVNSSDETAIATAATIRPSLILVLVR